MGPVVAAVLLSRPTAMSKFEMVEMARVTLGTASAGSPVSSTGVHWNLWPSTPPALLMSSVAASHGAESKVPNSADGPLKGATTPIFTGPDFPELASAVLAPPAARTVTNPIAGTTRPRRICFPPCCSERASLWTPSVPVWATGPTLVLEARTRHRRPSRARRSGPHFEFGASRSGHLDGTPPYLSRQYYSPALANGARGGRRHFRVGSAALDQRVRSGECRSLRVGWCRCKRCSCGSTARSGPTRSSR